MIPQDFETKYVNKIQQGNCLDMLKVMPDESVNCCISSPPYWGLRAYGTDPVIWGGDEKCEHKWQGKKGKAIDNAAHKGQNCKGFRSDRYLNQPQFKPTEQFCSKCSAWRGELGLEPTPDLFIEHLMLIMAEVKRVLRKDGLCFINLSDTYNNTPAGKNPGGFQGAAMKKDPSYNAAQNRQKRNISLSQKSLCNVPERFCLAMEKQGWTKRSNIIWAKGISFCDTYSGSCMPDSAKGRPNKNGFEWIWQYSKNTKTLFWINKITGQMTSKKPLGTKGVEGVDWEWREHTDCGGKGCDGKRCVNGKVKTTLWEGWDTYYEQQFEEAEELNADRPRMGQGNQTKYNSKRGYAGGGTSLIGHSGNYKSNGESIGNPLGRTIRNVWSINPQAYPDAHYATFPEALVRPLIQMGCPEFVCKKCGLPRKKIYKSQGGSIDKDWNQHNLEHPEGRDPDKTTKMISDVSNGTYQKIELGYSDCGCNAGWTAGIVMDMFFGSGTVGKVAAQERRNWIGIELKPEYIKQAEMRVLEGEIGIDVSEQKQGQKPLFPVKLENEKWQSK